MLKNFQTLCLVALAFMATTACSLVEKDIDVHHDLTFLVDRAADTSPEFAVVIDKDTRDEDVENNKDHIKNSKIEKITLSVSEFTGDGSPLLSGDLEFTNQGSDNFKKLAAISNVDVKALASSGEEITVNIADEAARKELSDLIVGGNLLSFRLNGSTSSTPVVVKLHFKIYSHLAVGI